MSNHLAIATVTACLQRLLQGAIQGDVDGARVTTLRPTDLHQSTPETGVNVFLYQVISNFALSNSDTSPFRTRGRVSRRQSPLDLFYMLTFYGNDGELEPQRLLGSVVRTLNDRRSFSSELIRDAIREGGMGFLATSDLDEQIQPLNIMPLDLNLEDLSKTWSILFQTPYMLSLGYKVTVVVIDGEDPAQRALPVRQPLYHQALPFPSRPQLERVFNQASRWEAVQRQSVVMLVGHNLQGQTTRIRLGDREVEPTTLGDRQLTLDLNQLPPEGLRAGVQAIQVVHDYAGYPEFPVNRLESNLVPLVLTPTLEAITVGDLERNEGEVSGSLVLRLNPVVGRRQKVSVALNQWTSDNPAAYLIDLPPRSEDGAALTVPLAAIRAGEYLVAVRVDGAETPLTVDGDPDSSTFNWYNGPRVVLGSP